MGFRDDDRAQAIQIGAVLLFAVLVIAFSLYQAFVVPNQNAQVERNHLQTVEGQMQELRDGIVNVPKSGNGRSVRVSMGTTYPARAIALNPPPASGQLRTVGTDDPAINFTIANARAIDDETADYWNGTNRTRYTGNVVYTPDYNEFRNPPTLVYDTTTLSSQFADSGLWTTGQTLVDGRQLTLVAIDGSYDRGSSRTVSLDLEALSASTTDVAITNETGENVSVKFASRQNASAWRSLLREEEQWHTQGGYVVDVEPSSHPDPALDMVTVELAQLEQNRTYTLRMAKVGVGTGATATEATYFTAVGSRNVSEGETFTAEVRDGFNNPVSGIEVIPNVTSGCSLSPKRTDERGQVSYECEGQARVDLEIKGGDQDNESVTYRIGSVSSNSPDPSIDESATVFARNENVRVTDANFISPDETVDVSQYRLESAVSDNSGTGLDYVTFRLRDDSGAVVTGGTYQLDGVGTYDFSWYSPWFEDTDLAGDPSEYDVELTVVDNAGGPTTAIVGQDGTVQTLSIDSFGVQSQNQNNHARFDVQFEVSADAGVTGAEIELISTNSGSVVDTRSESYSGVTTVSEDIVRAVEEKGGAGEEYIVRLTITDTNGNQVREERSVVG